jgi:hypothetical protein
MKNSINPIKQNIRIKQYLGWFVTFVFPLAAKQLMEITLMPIAVAIFYWIACGILLRYTMYKSLPYFKPQCKKVTKEIIILFLVTFICAFLYNRYNIVTYAKINKDLIISVIIFTVLNGIFEPLVWVNIFDLAGNKLKINGFLAAFIYTILMHFLFWNRIISFPQGNRSLFIICQGIMFIISFVIYAKTEDITIFSIQQIIYNLILVLFGGFGVSSFLNIK